MRALLRSAIAGLFMSSMSANAANLCNCCDTGVAESCSSVCAPAKPVSGQCVAMVNYDGEATIAAGENPLYGISLRGLSLEGSMRPELESFRRLLEMARGGAEKDRKTSMRDFRKRKIDNAAVEANTQRYESAVVNYYLGLRAYRDRLAAVPK